MGRALLDDIWVRFKFLEDGDLAHGSGRHSLVLVLELDLLDGHEILGVSVPGAVDHPVGALADRLQPLKVIHPT